MPVSFETVRTRQGRLPVAARQAAMELAAFLYQEDAYRRLAARFLAQFHTLSGYRRWVEAGRPLLIPNRRARAKRETAVRLLDRLYRQAAESNRSPEGAEKLLGRLRGLVLEELVALLVAPRYTPPDLLARDARVNVDGQLVRSGTRQTIDVAGWRPTEATGELYEVKIFPGHLQDPGILDYLEALREHLGPGPVIGAMTFHYRATLELLLPLADHPELTFFALEDLSELSRGPRNT